MDVFERLNRRFGEWYESLFGGASDADLRPRDILRRILSTMEDQRREGLDGQIYVPNQYTLDIAVNDEDERHYLRTFLDADDLATAVRHHMEQHGYRTRGGLQFQINETAPPAADGEGGEGAARVRIRARFDATLPERPAGPSAVTPPEDIDDHAHPAPPVAPRALDDFADEEEPGTVPALALASLVVQMPGSRQEVYPLTTRGAQIGRSRQAGNDIILAGDGLVSKRHARIDHENGRFVLRDMGSTNGAFVNGEAVESGCFLQPGDEIRLGETTLLFRTAGAQGGARTPAPAASAAAPHRLIAESGEAFPLASEMVAGRALTSDIVLIGEGVAARHARVTLRGGDQVYVEDLGTPGGTAVNGERIPANFPVVVYDGDVLTFGNVPLRLERGGRT